MENGILGPAGIDEENLNISLTSNSTKYRIQILRSLHQDLENAGGTYELENVLKGGVLTNHQNLTSEHPLTD